MYYVYILESVDDKSWYIGFTSNLRQRIKDHLDGKGAKTTRLKKGWKLIYYESYLEKRDATGREIFLKSGSGRRFINKQLKYYLLNEE